LAGSAAKADMVRNTNRVRNNRIERNIIFLLSCVG
jgi:hypothetical protein